MILPVFLIYATLPWLVGGRCAAAYWQAIADVLAAGAEGAADIVPLVPAAASWRRLPPGHEAELICLMPKAR
jgi:hypothetical protein